MIGFSVCIAGPVHMFLYSSSENDTEWVKNSRSFVNFILINTHYLIIENLIESRSPTVITGWLTPELLDTFNLDNLIKDTDLSKFIL